jgi:hypothetical protein
MRLRHCLQSFKKTTWSEKFLVFFIFKFTVCAAIFESDEKSLSCLQFSSLDKFLFEKCRNRWIFNDYRGLFDFRRHNTLKGNFYEKVCEIIPFDNRAGLNYGTRTPTLLLFLKSPVGSLRFFKCGGWWCKTGKSDLQNSEMHGSKFISPQCKFLQIDVCHEFFFYRTPNATFFALSCFYLPDCIIWCFLASKEPRGGPMLFQH